MDKIITKIFSMFVIMMFGVLLRKKNLIIPQGMKQWNKIIFNFFFPASFFTSVLKVDILSMLTWRYVSAVLLGLFICFLFGYIGGIFAAKDAEGRAIITNLVFVANFVVVGTPMVVSVLGEEYQPYAVIALFIALFFHNAMPIVMFERLSPDGTTKHTPIGKLIWKTLSTPMIFAIIFGIILNLLGIGIGPLMLPLETIGSMSPTMMLISIGFALTFDIDKTIAFKTAFVSLVRSILVPLVLIFLLPLTGIEPEQTMVLTILFASPTAIFLYNIVDNYHLRPELTKYVIVVTMLGYLITCPAILWVAQRVLGI